MEKLLANADTSYKYIAYDVESYEALASKAITTGADVALYPSQKTIIVTPTKEAEDVIQFIGEYIDNSALNFRIYPMEIKEYSDLFSDTVLDGATAKKMANVLRQECDIDIFDLQKKLKEAKTSLETITKDRDNYQKWYHSSIVRESKIKEQLKAIGVLLNAINPNE